MSQLLLVGACAANFLNQADRAIMPLTIPEMASHYNWEMGTAGSILSAFPVGYIVTNIVGGVLAYACGRLYRSARVRVCACIGVHVYVWCVRDV